MSFKPHEIEYLNSADLGRLATIQPDGTLQNSPVGFSYNEALGTIDVVGYRMSKSKKFRNLATNNTVAFVVDDIASRSPWRVRCLEIRGTAEQADAARPASAHIDAAIIRITPKRIISFGIDDTDTEPHDLVPDSRDVPTTAD
ncbi:PPOX class F420-dependent oxidoreductase [Mycobacterium sp. CVI_P3]|uniref:PPOX class F420-dependent oxidoreductase n=1 Tax=Mycobacterium pinniadriaticum TaxID=2994102 RepID=A0ABT3S743_9MYCO|nr:PPOX class F420-dependent oxidoreductase [Mycobacterium pinniadriaticum]MCX2928815.1 PPOX class F420-dependent oxidoreductase [Mycobacterium pinniadriaticum]MCX2935318.1 PPOX class F420-dependent oxidoreductase [Mycobacterium pinniadriaticum]